MQIIRQKLELQPQKGVIKFKANLSYIGRCSIPMQLKISIIYRIIFKSSIYDSVPKSSDKCSVTSLREQSKGKFLFCDLWRKITEKLYRRCSNGIALGLLQIPYNSSTYSD